MLAGTDQQEGILAGEFGVQAALNGETGKMIAFKRQSDSPYSMKCTLEDVNVICNEEKTVPVEWITEDGSDVTEDLSAMPARWGYPLATYIPGGRNAGRVEQVHGGVCRNVAEDIANVELRPTFVSLVDDTGTGQDVIDKLARHKVNTRYIQRVPDGMGTWLAVFNNEGDVVAAISKRPDTNPLTDLLAEKGDEIFKDCDGIAIELDLEKDTVKQVLYFAQKYHKKVYAAVSNMSIAMERRDFLQQIDCFVCNQQEAGILFSDEYDHMGPEECAARWPLM